MDSIFKISFLFFLLTAVESQFQSGSSEDPKEKPNQFHINQNEEIRDIIKSEANSFFSRLWETLGQRLTTTNSETLSKLETLNDKIIQLNTNQKELFVNLSRTINTNMDSLHLNLSDSFNETFSRSDLKTELTDLSGLLTGQLRRKNLKVVTSLRNLSDSIEPRLVAIDMQGTGKLGALNISTWSTQQPLRSSIDASTTHTSVESRTERITAAEIPTFTEVEEVNEYAGEIEFTGGANLNLRTKIWVLQDEGGETDREMRFLLQENHLGKDARLSLWGSASEEDDQHVWIGSQRASNKWKHSAGNVIILTLTISPGAAEQSSFKLKFTTTTFSTEVCASELIREELTQVVSFPPNKTEDTPPWRIFVAVIAPPSGESFGLTLKYPNALEYPPNYCEEEYFVWSINESPTGLPYQKRTSYRNRCFSTQKTSEPLGNRTVEISKPLGNHNIAILVFRTGSSGTGRGIRVQVN